MIPEKLAELEKAVALWEKFGLSKTAIDIAEEAQAICLALREAWRERDEAQAEVNRLHGIVEVNDQRLADLADEKNKQISGLERYLDQCEEDLKKEQEGQTYWIVEAGKMRKERDEARERARSAERECDILTADRDNARLQANKQAGLYAGAVRERDEARAALRLLWDEATDPTRCEGSGVYLSEPCRTAVKAALNAERKEA